MGCSKYDLEIITLEDNEIIKRLGPITDLESDAITEILKNKIDKCRHLDGNTKIAPWTDSMLELRNMVCMEYMRQGYSKQKCIEKIQSRLGVSQPTAKNYYDTAINHLLEDGEEIRNEARKKSLERLNQVAEEAMKSGNLKIALSAYDQINKIEGLYTQKQEIKIDDIETVFKFGE